MDTKVTEQIIWMAAKFRVTYLNNAGGFEDNRSLIRANELSHKILGKWTEEGFKISPAHEAELMMAQADLDTRIKRGI